MTSFTRKLHKTDPSGAIAIHRQREYRNYRYGEEAPYLATFGKRTTLPILPAYFCSAPNMRLPENVVRAVDAYEARKQYALHFGIALNEVMVRNPLSDLPSR